MTNEQGGHLVEEAIEQGATPFPPYSSIEFCPEPYQKVIVYLSGTDEDFDKRAVAYALRVFNSGMNLYSEEFGDHVKAGFDGPRQKPEFKGPQRPQEAPQRPRTNERRGKAKVNYGNCPDHPDVQAVESVAKYQEWDEIDGEQVPAKFFCPGDQNGTGKNHSLWRSQLLV